MAELQPTTLEIDLGRVAVGETRVRSAVIRNEGGASLQLKDLTTALALDSRITLEISFPDAVTPGREALIEVKAEPSALIEGPLLAQYQIATNDPETPSLVVVVRLEVISTRLRFEPEILDFGPTLLGLSQTRAVMLHNRSDEPLRITTAVDAQGRPRLEGTDPLPFEVTAMLQPNTGVLQVDGATLLEPEQFWTFEVQYRPDPQAPPSPAQAHWQVQGCDHAGCETSVRFVAEGIVSPLLCEPTQIEFVAVNPEGRRTRTIRCRSRVEQPVQFVGATLGVQSSGAFLIESPEPRLLTSNEEVLITVHFEPEAADLGRLLEGSVEVQSQDPESGSLWQATTVPLRGVVGAASVEVEPLPLSLGTVVLATSRSRTLLVHNRGQATLSIDQVTIEDDTEGTLSLSASNLVIAPGQTERLQVFLWASAVGAVGARLLLSTNDPDQDLVEVPVLAKIVDPGPCEASVQTSQLEFGRVRVREPLRLWVEVINTGANDCLLADPQMEDGRSFSIMGFSAAQEQWIAPGERFKLSVVFRPQDAILWQDQLSFYLSTLTEPAPIDLSGVGEWMGLYLVPRMLDLGTTAPGCARTSSIALRNPTLTDIEVEEIELQTGDNALSVQHNLPLDFGYLLPKREFDFFEPGWFGAAPPSWLPTFQIRFAGNQENEVLSAVHVTVRGLEEPYVLPVQGRMASMDLQREVFRTGTRQMDILFVQAYNEEFRPENLPENSYLAPSIPNFIQALESEGVDYQIGHLRGDRFVNTDVPPPDRPAGTGQGLQGYLSDGPVQDVGNPDWRVLRPTTLPSPGEVLASMIIQGIDRCPCQQPNGAVEMLLHPVRRWGWNAPLFRPGADLALIGILSTVAGGQPSYQDYIRERVWMNMWPRGKESFSFSQVAAQPYADENGVIMPCGPYTMLEWQSFGYAARRTGGFVVDYCDLDWAQTLRAQQPHIYGWRRHYPLSQKLRSGTSPTVLLDGQQIPAVEPGGTVLWSYDTLSNAVLFSAGHAPPRERTLTIEYLPACAP